MIHTICRVRSLHQVADNTFVLAFQAPEIALRVQGGQFINIKVIEGTDPLLRRPFSVYRCDGDEAQIIFTVVGKGSSCLQRKQEGDTLDVLGPLGVPFSVDGDFQTAVLVGGGLGVAPLPLTTQALQRQGKKVLTFIGARTAAHLVPHHLQNVHIATDDGSDGFRGNVVELIIDKLSLFKHQRSKLFACGPTKMLSAVAAFAREHDIPCEVSLEGPMACGFGICQGCPVELVRGERKYALICKDGPTFDIQQIKL
ncbi:MAG: dihydroorotate dehydrogenase electron transfer subunit [Ignavibacteria bacterium]